MQLLEKGKDAVEEALGILQSELANGKTESLSSFFKTIGKFRKYSFGNQMMIAFQAPYATKVAGFTTWKAVGRSVKKGSKGIMILAPMVGKDKEKPEVKKIFGFKTAYVFDLSQTEGEDLPSVDIDVKGDASENHLSLLNSFLAEKGIKVKNVELAHAYGTSSIGEIQINSNIKTGLGVLSTLIHEAAHELLHTKEDRLTLPKAVLEVEAEAVAFTVLHSLGYSVESLNPSMNYVAVHNQNKDILVKSLERVRNISVEILNAIGVSE